MKKVILTAMMLASICSSYAENDSNNATKNADIEMTKNDENESSTKNNETAADANWTFRADTEDANRLALYFNCQWGEQAGKVQVIYLTTK